MPERPFGCFAHLTPDPLYPLRLRYAGIIDDPELAFHSAVQESFCRDRAL